MIQSGAKVTVDQSDDNIVITILPESSPWQRRILAAWAVVWTFCGVLAMVSMLKQLNDETLAFFVVFFGFWCYFLFYATRSIIWQRSGAEYIRLMDGSLDYKRSWNGYGRAKSYDLETMKNLGVVEYGDKKFAKTYSDAFWTIGGEMIGFEYIGKKIAIGFKLDKGQAEDIVRKIDRVRKRH